MEVGIDKRTVTFINENNMTIKDVEQLFSRFSQSVDVNEHKKRIFVRLRTEAETANAIDCLSCLMQLKYAKKRIPSNDSKKTSTGDNSWEGLIIPEEDSISGFITKNDSKNGSFVKAKSASSSNIDSSGQSGSDIPVPPPLIDVKNVKKMYPIILANLPGPFTLEDVLNLVEECEPMGLTRIHHTSGKMLKFCEVYLKNSEDIAYLKKKLDGFVIGGKKLMAVEPSQCLTGAKWLL